jgi:DNA repair exonuclease SbcCD ATPase subunit
MRRHLTKKDLPRFDIINKYNVAIKSLRNQLKQANGIDELTNIAAKIVELEQQIMKEKTSGYKQLEEEKKLIEKRIDTLSRELNRAKEDLIRVGNSLDYKLNGYRKKLQERIDSLNNEYAIMVEYMSNVS